MKNERTIRVLIADDHPIVREGLRTLISRQADMEIVAEAAAGNEAVEQCVRHKPDVALIDLRMPELNGVEAIGAIRARVPSVRAIVLTTYDGNEDVYRSLRAGAKAYLLKDAPREELLGCIRTVHEGKTWISPLAAANLAARLSEEPLTPREIEVLRLIVAGKSNREIGAALFVTEGTIKLHVNHLLRKLKVSGRTEAIRYAVQRGIVHLD
ncbi:MAG TPA: response regulator transcription factor [Terriglobia bacterium]|jgi:two-component system NarL family response regulator|nr:response regulator transcription factor [Terriglobia bacterium]